MKSYVVFDFETTGFSPVKNEIIQIGAVKFDAETHEEVARFNQLIKPERSYVSTHIANLTGIHGKDLLDKPVIAEVLPDFLSFISGSLLIAHNANFDMSFLLQEVEDTGLELTESFEVYDTMVEAKRLISAKSYKLENLKKQLGMSDVRSHDALNDCLITAKLYQHLLGLVDETERPVSVPVAKKMMKTVAKAPKATATPEDEQLDLFSDFSVDQPEEATAKKLIYTASGFVQVQKGSPDSISEELRRELGLPITRGLVYYREVEHKSWAMLNVKGMGILQEYSSGASLLIALENNEEVCIHSDFLKEMQKANFIADYKK
ncbi:3'-5' exonuclease [Lactococcus termiticola]|uniref:DNA polymerase III polC-type n=1 Tax=Lactococcus termiticola TaxID=2169526 RepID=A0A2R5HK75_9LACT|nr:3'-5' exonuclease [Lactococcus termiticola]GBG97180.1 DNA polymerase III subunit epsilon [Lactococcus termiticola]